MNNYAIPNLGNACRIIRLIAEATQGMSRDEIADELAIPRSSAYRILQTLLGEQFIEQRNHRYYPGTSLYALGIKLNAVDRLRPVARPVLHSLAVHTGFTAHMAVPSGYRSLLLEVCDSDSLVRVASRAGSVVPLHVAATGKVFMAYLFTDELETIDREIGFARYTERTRTTVEAVRKEIQTTLKRGYALDDREYNDNVRCLAAPVFDASGSVVAAIGVTSTTAQFKKTSVNEVASLTREHAQRCFKRLKGWE